MNRAVPAELDLAVRQYLARAIDRNQLGRVARQAKLYGPFMDDFRKPLDCNVVAEAWVWRACWQARLTGDINQAAREFGVDRQDVRWVLDGLTAVQLRRLDARAMTPWTRHPDPDVMDAILESTRKYCQRYVRFKLAVVWRYDPGYTEQGLVEDMMAWARGKILRYMGRIVDHVHLRNLAYRSAVNWGKTFIGQYDRRGEMRVQRVAIDNVPLRTRVWRRPKAGASLQDVEQFKRSVKIVRDDTIVVPAGRFSSHIQLASELAHVDRSGNVEQFDSPDDRMVPTINDLDLQLAGQPEPVRQVCAVVLGRPVPAFDGWLSARMNGRSIGLSDRQLAQEACRFFSIDLVDVKRALAPVLGVAA
jgi:hypothetical protein